jgi:hypothetical protein
MFSEVVLCLMTYSWNIYYLLILMMCLHFNLSHLFLPLNFPTVAYPLSPSLPRPEILFRFSLLRLRSSHAAPDSSLPLPLLTGLLQPEPPPLSSSSHRSPHPSPSPTSSNGVGPNARPAWPTFLLLLLDHDDEELVPEVPNPEGELLILVGAQRATCHPSLGPLLP